MGTHGIMMCSHPLAGGMAGFSMLLLGAGLCPASLIYKPLFPGSEVVVCFFRLLVYLQETTAPAGNPVVLCLPPTLDS